MAKRKNIKVNIHQIKKLNFNKSFNKKIKPQF